MAENKDVDSSDHDETNEESDGEATSEQDNVQQVAADEETESADKEFTKIGDSEETESADKEFTKIGDSEETDEQKSDSDQKSEEKPRGVETSKKEPVTLANRPIRERRRTDFYIKSAYAKVAPSKFSVQQGSGTKLKDIPNVAFNLSKRKPDDTLLHSLHLLLFGKNGKNPTLKRNIGQFSGYVWAEDEAKERAQLREKFHTCIKNKLADFCDLLNISINKTTTRKGDVIDKLLEFLESPHATTESLLADKEQKAKTGKVTPSKPSPGEASTKKRKRTTEEQTPSSTDEEEETDDRSVSSDEDNSETEEDEPTKGGSRSNSKSTKKASPPTTRKRAREAADATSGSSSKAKEGPSSKKQKIEKEANGGSSSEAKSSVTKKQKGGSSKGKEKATVTKAPAKKKAPAKGKGKGKSARKPKAEPSREEIDAVVANMLKEADINTVTLSDVMQHLDTHFSMDLMHRKVEVKSIVGEVLNKITTDEEGQADEEKEEADEEKAESGDEQEADEELVVSGDEEESDSDADKKKKKKKDT